jgi:NADH-quinone oxidoreductase subunit J
MMLDIDVSRLRAGFWKHFPMAATIGALIALEMAAVLMGGFRPEEPRAMPAVAQAAAAGVQFSNTKELGKLLYSGYLFPLEVAAVILLVAIVAAIALTLRVRKDSRHLDPSLQVRVKARDRLQIMKIPPTVAAPPAEPVAAAVENKA